MIPIPARAPRDKKSAWRWVVVLSVVFCLCPCIGLNIVKTAVFGPNNGPREEFKGKEAAAKLKERGLRVPNYATVTEAVIQGDADVYFEFTVAGTHAAIDVNRDTWLLNRPPGWTIDDFEFEEGSYSSWDWNSGLANTVQSVTLVGKEPSYALRRIQGGSASSGTNKFKGKDAAKEISAKGLRLPGYTVVTKASIDRGGEQEQVNFTVTGVHSITGVIKDVRALNVPVSGKAGPLHLEKGVYEWDDEHSGGEEVLHVFEVSPTDGTYKLRLVHYFD